MIVTVPGTNTPPSGMNVGGPQCGSTGAPLLLVEFAALKLLPPEPVEPELPALEPPLDPEPPLEAPEFDPEPLELPSLSPLPLSLDAAAPELLDVEPPLDPELPPVPPPSLAPLSSTSGIS
jgi:hypothetical protein